MSDKPREQAGAAALEFAVRDAHEGDAAALAAIYAHHVLHGLATFEIEPPDAAEIARRLKDLQARGYPWLVAESSDLSPTASPRRLLGYAYAGPYRARAAYRHTVEDSIYLCPEAAGQGLGRALLVQLIEAAVSRGYRQMVAVIGDSDNAASIGLHAACGFEPAGMLRAVGFKFGRWVDSVQMQRALGPGASTPPD